MSRQYWEEALAWSTADGTAVTANNTETIIFPNVTLDANYMADGRALMLECWGKITTTTVNPTLQFRCRWGGVSGTLLADSGAITTGGTARSSVTNGVWAVLLRITTRTNGAAGTLFAMGMAILFGSTAAAYGSSSSSSTVVAMTVGGVTGPAASAAVDLTAAAALAITATWSTSGQSLTGHNYYLEGIN